MLDEVGATGRGRRPGLGLGRGIGVRAALSESSGGQASSPVGQAGLVFELDHR